MALQKIDVTGPLFSYTNNDSRIIQEQFDSFDPNDEVEIYWHSPGGDTREGNKIFNTILSHKGKTTSKVLLAASAASYAAMGSDEMEVYDYSEFMIHSAMMATFVLCNRSQIDGVIEFLNEHKPVLEKLDSQIANIYSKRASVAFDKVMKWMGEETTWRGEEIHKVGFATKFVDTPPRTYENMAKFDLSCYQNHQGSKWHEQYSPNIDAKEAWYAQTAAILLPDETGDAKNTEAATTNESDGTPEPDDHVKLARIAKAKRRLEHIAMQRKSVLG